ncbi:MBL fold metallo-hydrolase [Marine Group I thaumarchaeote]|uniref:MBL fold metallo-hydrolase n=1 Tax=Marine Group I thaumarchaeote TaxID=2511932 RepID=A0A7K4P400_9ARCH|nr:MBL fold metallo-hydrolase [Marine Group I thaumarchaeote]
MTSITFHGGVNDIGGNKFLVKDKDTTVFMDFGMSFSQEGEFFAQFLNARGSNFLTDMFELGMLPKIKGMYRRDYAKHVGFDGNEETEIDAILLTHAHVDHCAYIQYLREDIPIYCSEESKLIMQNFDETGTDQYLTHKEKFQFYKNKTGGVSRATGDKVAYPRNIQIFQSNKEFSIDSIRVEPLPVDHSIPGVHAFILHTSNGSIGNTADLRFHGRRKDDTEKFVERCAKSDLDILLCEGTRVNKTSSLTEYDVETKVADIVNNTKGLAICGYPIRDLDRLMSFFIAAKNSNRYLVIDMKQAYLLKLFTESESMKGKYPSPIDKNIKIYIQRGSWGLIDKDLKKFSDKQLYADYAMWQRPFLDYPNAIDYRDIQKKQNEYIFFCSDFRLQDLIDIKPDEGATYIRSLTEPFDLEMELKEEQIKNWFTHFGVIKKDQDWHQIHVSGHGDGEQIKKVIDGANSKKLIPIHTKHDEYHKKWHSNVQSVNQHDSVDL